MKNQIILNTIYFCIMFLLSAFGYEFLFFIMTVHVYDITESPLNVGVFTAITIFPKILSPFYGVIVDRYNRDKVFSLMAGVMGGVIIILGFLQNLYLIYVTWFIVSIFLMFIINVRTALMTEILPQNNYMWGNSLVLVFLNIAKLLAPLSGGVVMLFYGKQALILFTSIVYFVSMILALFLSLPERPERTTIKLTSFFGIFIHVKEGISYIWDNHHLKKLSLIAFLWRLFLGLQLSIFIVYIQSFLGKGEALYGLFMTIIGIGSLIGSFCGPWIVKKVNVHTVMAMGLLFHYATFASLGFINNYYFASIIAFISFLVFYLTLVSLHSIRDRFTESLFRGRVYGSVSAFLTPPAIISMILGGYMAEFYGAGKVIIVAGALATVSFVFVLLFYAQNNKDTPSFRDNK